MSKFYLMHGVAGSCKSTFINNLKKIYKNIEVVSKDDFRIVNGKYVFDLETEYFVEYQFFKALETASGVVFVDNTHLNERFKNKVMDFIRRTHHFSEIKIISIIPGAPEEHAKNNCHGLTLDEVKRQIETYKTPDDAIVYTLEQMRSWKTAEEFKIE